MKTYAYYPGCSLEKMAHGYHVSTLESTQALGVELKELEDWNCCGATAYFHVDEILAYTLCARNLAMAEQMGLDVVAPCSGCFKNMFFTTAGLKKDPDLLEHVNFALEEDNLSFKAETGVKHLIEVFTDDVGYAELESKVTHPLEGLRVAPYYGCQIVRPRKASEEVEEPMYFEKLMSAIGATPVDYSLKLRCCGGSLIATGRDAALTMVRNLLQNAQDREADVIATACPLCQINLECYQNHVNREMGTTFDIPIMYFTQLVGLALGVPSKRLGIGKELVSTAPVVAYAKERVAD